ncbi:MAG: alpha/beta fold hydrolase [Acidimicrobiia bacterium]|nr:MAG: alpha/beta fold hydrolase [Acidimicrobiia bacterium]
MGRRTSQRMPPPEPLPRKKLRTPLGVLTRAVSIIVAVLLAIFLIAGFYFSGVLRDDALRPPSNEPVKYVLEATSVGGTTVTITGPESNDQLGQDGVQGIAWANGYVQSPSLASTSRSGNERTDIRTLPSDATGPTAGTAVNLDPFAYTGNPLDALGIDYEDVTYTSNIDSFPAWFIPGTSDTWAIVVHGKGASREEGLRVIPILKDLGYPILVISYRNDVGEARDPSGYHQYGETEWVDVAAAVTYAQENGAVDHILFGYSMGGAIVTSYLTQSPLRNFTKAAILDSPVLSFEQTVDFQASRTNLPLLPVKVPGVLTQFAKWISSWRFDIDWDATDYLSQTGNLHAPMLIFHGTRDTSVPYATSAEIARLRPDIVTLVTTEASHTRSWNVDPQAYEAAIKDFLAGLD